MGGPTQTESSVDENGYKNTTSTSSDPRGGDQVVEKRERPDGSFQGHMTDHGGRVINDHTDGQDDPKSSNYGNPPSVFDGSSHPDNDPDKSLM